MLSNEQIVLAKRPVGLVREDDFSRRVSAIPTLKEGEFRVRNLYLSMDSGFRKYMNEGAGDNYLPTMTLGEPVQSIVLGRVAESRHPGFAVDALVMGRKSWESYSTFSDSDFVQKLEVDETFPLAEYVATMGPTGMTAYFGLQEVGRPRAGETVLVSAAGGAVGSVVGQIAKIRGCRTVGITSSVEKGRWLMEVLGYDAVLNHRDPQGLLPQMRREMPDGFDIYFDNVGGRMLDTAIQHMKERARIVLCGAISQYDKMDHQDAIHHMWEFIPKRALAAGFMFSDYVADYPKAIGELAEWICQGKLKSIIQTYEGIGQAPKAFCDMLAGHNRGKCIVKL